MPKITLTHQDGQQDRYQLDGKLFTIGRAPDNDIVLPDGSSSNHHAVLKRTGDGDFSISDLGSTNHTRVNGTKISTQQLRSGDRLLLGDTLADYESEVVTPDRPSDTATRTVAPPPSRETASTPPHPPPAGTTTPPHQSATGCLGLITLTLTATTALASSARWLWNHFL